MRAGLDTFGDPMILRVGAVVRHGIVEHEVYVSLLFCERWQSERQIKVTHCEVFDAAILVLFELGINGSPAHRLLDHLIIVWHVDAIDMV